LGRGGGTPILGMFMLKVISFIIGIVIFVIFGTKTYDATVAEDSNKFLGYFLFTIAGLLLMSVIFA
jgi:hypothetical protein